MKPSNILASLSVVMALATSTFAADVKPACDKKMCKDDFGGHNMHQMMFKKMVKSLNLSAEQKVELATLEAQMKEQMRANFKDKPNIGAYIKDGVFDKAAFTTDATLRGAKMIEGRAEFMSKFVALLTPEQKTKLSEYKPKEYGCKK